MGGFKENFDQFIQFSVDIYHKFLFAHICTYYLIHTKNIYEKNTSSSLAQYLFVELWCQTMRYEFISKKKQKKL